MSNIPADLKFLTSHEWVRLGSDGTAYVGISDHAQEALGDLVFVEAPEVGSEVVAGEDAGVVESVKAASDIYSPLSGEVIEINAALQDAPETVNSDAFGEGWIFKIRVKDAAEHDDLLTADAYGEQLKSEG